MQYFNLIIIGKTKNNEITNSIYNFISIFLFVFIEKYIKQSKKKCFKTHDTNY